MLAFRQRGGRQFVADDLARAYEAFPVLGERRSQRGGTLSGGQQRLLSLAKVLVCPPRLLVADELSLGPRARGHRRRLRRPARNQRAGTAVLVVEQQVDRALELARSAVVLEHGVGRLRAARRPGAGRGRAGARRAAGGGRTVASGEAARTSRCAAPVQPADRATDRWRRLGAGGWHGRDVPGVRESARRRDDGAAPSEEKSEPK